MPMLNRVGSSSIKQLVRECVILLHGCFDLVRLGRLAGRNFARLKSKLAQAMDLHVHKEQRD
jgi:hypothetical protein